MGENGPMRAALLVAVGAACGATVRWSAGEAFAREPGAFPWATLLVNLAGCALAGVALSTIPRGTDRWFGLVTGGLGGLTTMSAFAVETRELWAADRPLVASTYVVASMLGGVLAVELGRARRRSAVTS